MSLCELSVLRLWTIWINLESCWLSKSITKPASTENYRTIRYRIKNTNNRQVGYGIIKKQGFPFLSQICPDFWGICFSYFSNNNFDSCTGARKRNKNKKRALKGRDTLIFAGLETLENARMNEIFKILSRWKTLKQYSTNPRQYIPNLRQYSPNLRRVKTCLRLVLPASTPPPPLPLSLPPWEGKKGLRWGLRRNDCLASHLLQPLNTLVLPGRALRRGPAAIL